MTQNWLSGPAHRPSLTTWRHVALDSMSTHGPVTGDSAAVVVVNDGAVVVVAAVDATFMFRLLRQYVPPKP